MWARGDLSPEAEDACRRAATYARKADDQRELTSCLTVLSAIAAFGPTPVEEAIRTCKETLRSVEGYRYAEANTLQNLG